MAHREQICLSKLLQGMSQACLDLNHEAKQKV